MKKLKHGNKINITKVYGSYKRKGNKIWKQHDIEHKNCIFLGYRTIKEGRIEYCSEGGYVFCPTNHIRVMLVSINSALNPVYSPLKEDVADG